VSVRTQFFLSLIILSVLKASKMLKVYILKPGTNPGKPFRVGDHFKAVIGFGRSNPG